ncbi:restriction endonuclease subunit S [Pseudomonas leptonychotis]|uniref:restriction endonuclease subunit S n=1 Tax=Pseudomonas leptonychotis TaxID=2448482 RepID=UPI0039EFCA69
MIERNLKAGWRRVKFGDVVRLSKGRSKDPLADGIERYVGLEHLEPGDLRIRSWGRVADGVTFTSMFQPGQVLFGKRRAYQRKVAVADFSGVCSGDIYVLETKDPHVLLPELLPFICQTDAFFDHAVGTSAGSLSPRTNWTSLADFEFALPCMEDQASLVELLSASLSAVHAAEMIRIRVSELRKSLTAEHLGNGSDASGVVTPWGTLPLHWRYIPVGDVTMSSAYGPRFPSTLYADKGNARTIRTTDFCGVDEINLTTAPAATLDKGMVEDHALCAGDFLLSRSGEYAGKTRVFLPMVEDRFIPAAFLIRYRLSQTELRPKYLHYICSSPIGQSVLSSLVQGSAQPNIAGSAFLALKIPVPPIEEQDHVIGLVDDLSNADRVATERFTKSRALMGTMLAAMQAVQHV